MLAGKGVRAIAVMWAVTFVSFILVPLRLYTRVYIVKALGVDDHVYNLAWVRLRPLQHRESSSSDIALTEFPGISAPVHHLSHDRRCAWIRTVDRHLGNG